MEICMRTLNNAPMTLRITIANVDTTTLTRGVSVGDSRCEQARGSYQLHALSADTTGFIIGGFGLWDERWMRVAWWLFCRLGTTTNTG